MVTVRGSKIHGRGVFANRTIYPSTFVERAPILTQHVDRYSFRPGTAMGKMSFLNHDDHPNCYVIQQGQELVLVAARRIKRGQELTISYGKDFWEAG